MTGLPQRLKELAVCRLPPGIAERIAEEWQAHLDALPDGLSKLTAAAGFLFSTVWGFRRYREHETPIEIEERIALAVAVAVNQERERIRSALEAAERETMAGLAARQLAAEEKLVELEKLRRENRVQLVKRRTNGRSSAFALPNGYKTTRHKGVPYRYKTTPV